MLFGCLSTGFLSIPIKTFCSFFNLEFWLGGTHRHGCMAQKDAEVWFLGLEGWREFHSIAPRIPPGQVGVKEEREEGRRSTKEVIELRHKE